MGRHHALVSVSVDFGDGALSIQALHLGHGMSSLSRITLATGDEFLHNEHAAGGGLLHRR